MPILLQLGLPREIQEVRNAFAAYEQLPKWKADSEADCLTAHGFLMAGLVDEAGCYRNIGVTERSIERNLKGC